MDLGPTGSPLATLSLIAACLLVHESWRWAGLFLGRNLSIDSPVFRWVQLVATSLIAALVSRMVIFPAGGLSDVPLAARILAFSIGAAAFFLTRRSVAAGVITAGLALLALDVWSDQLASAARIFSAFAFRSS